MVDSKYLTHVFNDNDLGYISSDFDVASPRIILGAWGSNVKVPMGQNGPAWYGAEWTRVPLCPMGLVHFAPRTLFTIAIQSQMLKPPTLSNSL